MTESTKSFLELLILVALVLYFEWRSQQNLFGGSHLGGRIKLTSWHACPESRSWQVLVGALYLACWPGWPQG